MANINPIGVDLTTGQIRPLSASDTLTKSTGAAVASNVPVASKTANYTITIGDSYLSFDTTSGNLTATLLLASVSPGLEVTIAKISSDTNSLTVACSGGDTINGSSNVITILQYATITLLSNGTSWTIKNIVNNWKGSAFPVSQTSLQAAWTFDNGTLTDASGNGLTLTQTGSGITYPVDQKFFNGALYTGNASDYLSRGATDDAVFDFGSGDFTISMWVSWGPLLLSGGEQVLIEKFTAASGPGWTFYKKSGSAALELFADGTADLLLTAPALLVDDGDFHQVGIRRSSNTWWIFYDGYVIATATSSNTISDTTKPLMIGRRDGGTSPFYGCYDDIAIWTRALSLAEIQTLCRSKIGRPATYTMLTGNII